MLSIRMEAKGSGSETEMVGMSFTDGRTGLHRAITADGALSAFLTPDLNRGGS